MIKENECEEIDEEKRNGGKKKTKRKKNGKLIEWEQIKDM